MGLRIDQAKARAKDSNEGVNRAPHNSDLGVCLGAEPEIQHDLALP